MRRTTSALSLVVLLTTAACGTATQAPGSGGGTPADDDPATATGPGAGPGAGDDRVLPATQGDGGFFIEGVSVRVAESHPVQLFLDVQGDAPTPCHTVAYRVDRDGDTISVRITTVESEQTTCTQVLAPHEFVVPLGEAPTLPVTVDVNSGEFVETVDA